MSHNKNCDSCYSCDSCDSCNSCDFCYYCNSCYFCDFCDFCYYCNSCDFCYYCNSCYFCYYCNSCYYSKELRMSEHMIFCLGEGRLKSEGEGYQKNYKVFNKDVSKKEYEKIRGSLDIKLKLTEWNEETNSLDVYNYEDAWKNWWDNASKKDKESITGLKQFDTKIFKEITGIDITVNSAEQEAIDLLKKNGYKIIKT